MLCGLECDWPCLSAEQKREMLCAFLRGLCQHGLMVAGEVIVRHERRSIRLKSGADLLTAYAEWDDDGGYYVFPSKDCRGKEYELTVAIWPEALRLDLYLGGGQLELRRGSLITAFTAYLKKVISSHARSADIGFAGTLSVRDMGYPRVRPPRNWQVCSEAGLVDLIDARFASRHGYADAAERLGSLDLPSGAAREEVGDALIIQWASDDDVKNDALMKTRLSTREQWLTGALPDAPIRAGWNIDGEVESDPVAAKPHPPLTLYSPPLAVGYQAVHTAVGEESVQDELRRIADWIKKGTLADGTVVSDVIVIADSRPAALGLRPLAQTRGIRHILYVGDDGHMWDPFPEGEWV